MKSSRTGFIPATKMNPTQHGLHVGDVKDNEAKNAPKPKGMGMQGQAANPTEVAQQKVKAGVKAANRRKRNKGRS